MAEQKVIQTLYSQIKHEIEDKFLFGQSKLIDALVTSYLARGHVLIEGPPGTSKTMSSKILSQLFARKFKRIQFTSDLLPSDVIGTHVYSQSAQGFQFIEGPIFADFVLADEINRTPPRTQSALLEAMEERQVTSDGKIMKLSEDFFVVATQNPQDFEGTFPLPEVQLDRFLIKIVLQHADKKVEAQVLGSILSGQLPIKDHTLKALQFNRASVDAEISAIQMQESLLHWIALLLETTRNHSQISYGSSLRGGIALLKCSRVWAALQGRQFVIPDDLKKFVVPCLRHRIRLSPEAQINQTNEEQILLQIVEKCPFPT